MKRKLYTLVVLFGLFLTLPSAIKSTKYIPVKRALIVAVGTYNDEENWSNLGSANDVELMKNALLKQDFKDIRVLLNQEADKNGIIKAFQELTKNSNPDDVCVIHFSSHGQQVFDFDGDELDGLDESIVPYGAPATAAKGYKGEKHLKDDELGTLLNNLRAKLGPKGDVLVTVDACYSGTISRGKEKTRGGKTAIIPTGKKVASVGSDTSSLEIKTKGFDASKMAPLVVISGAQADQENHEFHGNGSLTVAFTNALNNVNTSTTYSGLFASILTEMSLIAKQQTPAAEGKMNRKLFSNLVVEQESYYTLRGINSNVVFIDGGTLTNLNEGTKIELYEAGTNKRDTTKRIATAIINNVSENSATADADIDLGAYTKTQLWAFVTERTFGDAFIKVQILADNATEKADFETRLSKIPFILKVEDSADVIIKKEPGFIRLINASNGYIFENIKFNPATYYGLLYDKLENYLRTDIMRKMEFKNPEMNVEIVLVPSKNEKFDTSAVAMSAFSKKIKNGVLNLKTTDTFHIMVKNKGSLGAYFNILDIMSDGSVGVLFPIYKENQSPTTYYIEKGKTLILERYISLSPPYGTEIFKLFATSEPVNMASIETTRGNPSAKQNVYSHPIEKIYANTFKLKTRAKVGSAPVSEAGSTFCFPINVIK